MSGGTPPLPYVAYMQTTIYCGCDDRVDKRPVFCCSDTVVECSNPIRDVDTYLSFFPYLCIPVYVLQGTDPPSKDSFPMFMINT
jgi:hypothetical protein